MFTLVSAWRDVFLISRVTLGYFKNCLLQNIATDPLSQTKEWNHINHIFYLLLWAPLF